jgi:uroporphyrin-III C-methyltransferase
MLNRSKLILIGAGPGDPELITIKAIKALGQADVILYDNLVNRRVFDLLADMNSGRNPAKEPELIYSGKLKGESYKQDEINSMILKYLSQNKVVVRLKGGDPFVFARGVEELELACQAGYEVEVIPGLTSGLAVPVMNQITLTHRNKSDTIVFATGHEVNEEKFCLWINALEKGATLLLYMALGNIVEISEKLSPKLGDDFPVIAIENGSLIDQRIIEANLDSINQKLIDKSFKSPVMFVIGQHVQKLRSLIGINASSLCREQ